MIKIYCDHIFKKKLNRFRIIIVIKFSKNQKKTIFVSLSPALLPEFFLSPRRDKRKLRVNKFREQLNLHTVMNALCRATVASPLSC